ncbi:MAG: methyltransferase domain-containing protein [Phycisphaerae bacterium]|nr:methyltransferase domain-containing protein [Phycisphaerae bacterium]
MPEALERLDPAAQPDHQAAQHYARYEWAAGFLPAHRVLDCACGFGYGSALLRERGASSVLGVDVSDDALRYARAHYARDGIEYRAHDALKLRDAGIGPFDLIVSLETIEHVADPRALLDVYASLLAPEGVLAVSVPHDAYLGSTNPYHLWRADFDEFHGWLRDRFPHVGCYVESHTVGCGIWPRARAARAAVPGAAMLRVLDGIDAARATGFLFACSRTPVRTVNPVAAELLDGFGYMRELEAARDRLWSENQRQAAHLLRVESWARDREAEAARLSASWTDQRALIDELEKERLAYGEEAQKLVRAWDEQAARLAEIDAARAAVWEDLQRLKAEWESQGRQLADTRADRDKIWAESQRLVGQVASQGVEMAALREQLGRVLQEASAAHAEAARQAAAWSAQCRVREAMEADRDRWEVEAKRLAAAWEVERADRLAAEQEGRRILAALQREQGEVTALRAAAAGLEDELRGLRDRTESVQASGVHRFLSAIRLIDRIELNGRATSPAGRQVGGGSP